MVLQFPHQFHSPIIIIMVIMIIVLIVISEGCGGGGCGAPIPPPYDLPHKNNIKQSMETDSRVNLDFGVCVCV